MTTIAQPAVANRLSLYGTMLTIRRFEETALELRREEVAQGSMHLCAGQEAIPTGALALDLASAELSRASARGARVSHSFSDPHSSGS